MFNIASWRPTRLPGVGIRDTSVITVALRQANARDQGRDAINVTPAGADMAAAISAG
jgi:hypothetical protein